MAKITIRSSAEGLKDLDVENAYFSDYVGERLAPGGALSAWRVVSCFARLLEVLVEREVIKLPDLIYILWDFKSVKGLTVAVDVYDGAILTKTVTNSGSSNEL